MAKMTEILLYFHIITSTLQFEKFSTSSSSTKMNYKNYQQVVCLNTKQPKVTKKQRTIRKPVSTTGKKRTKTGCLTCRKRKKKCDEEKIDGKCQACTRNFLQCCWPEAAVAEAVASAPAPEITKTPMSSPTASPLAAYPSPKSPIDLHSDDEIKSLSLGSSNYKLVSRKEDPRKTPKTMADTAAATEIKATKNELKFIITSIDSHQELCQISAN